MTSHTKVCRICGKTKPLEQMAKLTKNGKVYARSRCKACDNERCTRRRLSSSETAERYPRDHDDENQLDAQDVHKPSPVLEYPMQLAPREDSAAPWQPLPVATIRR